MKLLLNIPVILSIVLGTMLVVNANSEAADSDYGLVENQVANPNDTEKTEPADPDPIYPKYIP